MERRGIHVVFSLVDTQLVVSPFPIRLFFIYAGWCCGVSWACGNQRDPPGARSSVSHFMMFLNSLVCISPFRRVPECLHLMIQSHCWLFCVLNTNFPQRLLNFSLQIYLSERMNLIFFLLSLPFFPSLHCFFFSFLFFYFSLGTPSLTDGPHPITL